MAVLHTLYSDHSRHGQHGSYGSASHTPKRNNSYSETDDEQLSVYADAEFWQGHKNFFDIRHEMVD